MRRSLSFGPSWCGLDINLRLLSNTESAFRNHRALQWIQALEFYYNPSHRRSSEAISSISLGTGLAFSRGLVTSDFPHTAQGIARLLAIYQPQCAELPRPCRSVAVGAACTMTARHWDQELGPSPRSGSQHSSKHVG